MEQLRRQEMPQFVRFSRTMPTAMQISPAIYCRIRLGIRFSFMGDSLGGLG